jgi:hypothetical protein
MLSEDEVIEVTAPWVPSTRWLECEEIFILFFQVMSF